MSLMLAYMPGMGPDSVTYTPDQKAQIIASVRVGLGLSSGLFTDVQIWNITLSLSTAGVPTIAQIVTKLLSG